MQHSVCVCVCVCARLHACWVRTHPTETHAPAQTKRPSKEVLAQLDVDTKAAVLASLSEEHQQAMLQELPSNEVRMCMCGREVCGGGGPRETETSKISVLEGLLTHELQLLWNA